MNINRDYIFGILTAMIFSAIGMLVAAMLPNALWGPNVTYDVTRADDASSVCPGDVRTFDVLVGVSQPSVIEVNTVFANAQTHENVPAIDPIDFSGTRAYPYVTVIPQTVNWQVPALPPGDYVRITAAVSRFSDATPVFIEIPFTVKEGCP